MTAVPTPRAETETVTAPETNPPARRSRGTLAAMLALVVAGAALALVAAGRDWAHGAVNLQGTRLSVSATGSDITGAPSALALVGLAAAVAVFAARGVGRYAMGVLVLLAGAGTAFSAVSGASGGTALDEKAGRAMGLTTATASGVTHSMWPWVSALGGVLLLLAGVVTLLRGRAWPTMSSRYDAPTARKSSAAPQTPSDLWKALDRGEDPTD